MNSKIRKKARALMLRRDSKTVYVAVAPNIYFDGLSYRTRVTRNGVRKSLNWSNKADAIWCRNELRAGRDVE